MIVAGEVPSSMLIDVGVSAVFAIPIAQRSVFALPSSAPLVTLMVAGSRRLSSSRHSGLRRCRPLFRTAAQPAEAVHFMNTGCSPYFLQLGPTASPPIVLDQQRAKLSCRVALLLATAASNAVDLVPTSCSDRISPHDC